LYIVAVDDFVWVLMQVVRYYQYLKDDSDTNSGKEELLLRVVQRSVEQIGDLKVLNVTMAKLLGTDLFCTREPHLAREEIFGSQKRKADVPLGFKSESY
jgi:hypothetical protein